MTLILQFLTGQEISRNLYDCIAKVETGGSKDPDCAVGDNGKAYGRYQIWEVYYNDAVEFNPLLETWKNTKGHGSKTYSEQVMQSYMNRYATEARLGRKPTNEDIARIHNGGPNGYKKESTLKYWKKVEKCL